MTTFTQPDSRFRGPAYQYLRDSDELPTQPKLAEDPLCTIKLFLPEGRTSYFIAAVTPYDTVFADGDLVVTCWCQSPLGEVYDEWGDSSLTELSRLRSSWGLPLERDEHFEAQRLSQLRGVLAALDGQS